MNTSLLLIILLAAGVIAAAAGWFDDSEPKIIGVKTKPNQRGHLVRSLASVPRAGEDQPIDDRSDHESLYR